MGNRVHVVLMLGLVTLPACVGDEPSAGTEPSSLTLPGALYRRVLDQIETQPSTEWATTLDAPELCAGCSVDVVARIAPAYRTKTRTVVIRQGWSACNVTVDARAAILTSTCDTVAAKSGDSSDGSDGSDDTTCTPVTTGSSTTCTVSASCGGHTYEVSCVNFSECTCYTDGVAGITSGNLGGTCTSTTGLPGWGTYGCNFPN